MVGELDLYLDFFVEEVGGQERGNLAPLDSSLFVVESLRLRTRGV